VATAPHLVAEVAGAQTVALRTCRLSRSCCWPCPGNSATGFWKHGSRFSAPGSGGKTRGTATAWAIRRWTSPAFLAWAAGSYVKYYNVPSSSVVVGSTPPDEVLYAPAGTVITLPYFTWAESRRTFGVTLSAAGLTTGGRDEPGPECGSFDRIQLGLNERV
jgi:hypothetical protein